MPNINYSLMYRSRLMVQPAKAIPVVSVKSVQTDGLTERALTFIPEGLQEDPQAIDTFWQAHQKPITKEQLMQIAQGQKIDPLVINEIIKPSHLDNPVIQQFVQLYFYYKEHFPNIVVYRELLGQLVLGRLGQYTDLFIAKNQETLDEKKEREDILEFILLSFKKILFIINKKNEQNKEVAIENLARLSSGETFQFSAGGLKCSTGIRTGLGFVAEMLSMKQSPEYWLYEKRSQVVSSMADRQASQAYRKHDDKNKKILAKELWGTHFTLLYQHFFARFIRVDENDDRYQSFFISLKRIGFELNALAKQATKDFKMLYSYKAVVNEVVDRYWQLLHEKIIVIENAQDKSLRNDLVKDIEEIIQPFIDNGIFGLADVFSEEALWEDRYVVNPDFFKDLPHYCARLLHKQGFVTTEYHPVVALEEKFPEMVDGYKVSRFSLDEQVELYYFALEQMQLKYLAIEQPEQGNEEALKARRNLEEKGYGKRKFQEKVVNDFLKIKNLESKISEVVKYLRKEYRKEYRKECRRVNEKIRKLKRKREKITKENEKSLKDKVDSNLKENLILFEKKYQALQALLVNPEVNLYLYHDAYSYMALLAKLDLSLLSHVSHFNSVLKWISLCVSKDEVKQAVADLNKNAPKNDEAQIEAWLHAKIIKKIIYRTIQVSVLDVKKKQLLWQRLEEINKESVLQDYWCHKDNVQCFSELDESYLTDAECFQKILDLPKELFGQAIVALLNTHSKEKSKILDQLANLLKAKLSVSVIKRFVDAKINDNGLALAMVLTQEQIDFLADRKDQEIEALLMVRPSLFSDDHYKKIRSFPKKITIDANVLELLLSPKTYFENQVQGFSSDDVHFEDLSKISKVLCLSEWQRYLAYLGCLNEQISSAFKKRGCYSNFENVLIGSLNRLRNSFNSQLNVNITPADCRVCYVFAQSAAFLDSVPNQNIVGKILVYLYKTNIANAIENTPSFINHLKTMASYDLSAEQAAALLQNPDRIHGLQAEHFVFLKSCQAEEIKIMQGADDDWSSELAFASVQGVKNDFPQGNNFSLRLALTNVTKQLTEHYQRYQWSFGYSQKATSKKDIDQVAKELAAIGQTLTLSAQERVALQKTYCLHELARYRSKWACNFSGKTSRQKVLEQFLACFPPEVEMIHDAYEEKRQKVAVYQAVKAAYEACQASDPKKEKLKALLIDPQHEQWQSLLNLWQKSENKNEALKKAIETYAELMPASTSPAETTTSLLTALGDSVGTPGALNAIVLPHQTMRLEAQ